jgi:hypothetical protein
VGAGKHVLLKGLILLIVATVSDLTL